MGRSIKIHGMKWGPRFFSNKATWHITTEASWAWRENWRAWSVRLNIGPSRSDGWPRKTNMATEQLCLSWVQLVELRWYWWHFHTFSQPKWPESPARNGISKSRTSTFSRQSFAEMLWPGEDLKIAWLFPERSKIRATYLYIYIYLKKTDLQPFQIVVQVILFFCVFFRSVRTSGITSIVTWQQRQRIHLNTQNLHKPILCGGIPESSNQTESLSHSESMSEETVSWLSWLHWTSAINRFSGSFRYFVHEWCFLCLDSWGDAQWTCPLAALPMIFRSCFWTLIFLAS